MKATLRDKYRIPYRLIEYLCGLEPTSGEFDLPRTRMSTLRVSNLSTSLLNTTEAVEEAKAEIDKLGLLNLPDLEDEDEVDDDWMGTKTFLAYQMANNDKDRLGIIRGAVEA